MRRPIKHSLIADLIQLAQESATADLGKPRKAALRRAVSSAYYALFHALCYTCAEELVGWTRWELFEPIYRTVDHREAKARLLGRDGRTLGPEVERLGPIFGTLQEERHRADYDPRPFSLSRAEVLALIGQASEAVRRIEEMPPQARRALAVLLISKPGRS